MKIKNYILFFLCFILLSCLESDIKEIEDLKAKIEKLKSDLENIDVDKEDVIILLDSLKSRLEDLKQQIELETDNKKLEVQSEFVFDENVFLNTVSDNNICNIVDNPNELTFGMLGFFAGKVANNSVKISGVNELDKRSCKSLCAGMGTSGTCGGARGGWRRPACRNCCSTERSRGSSGQCAPPADWYGFGG